MKERICSKCGIGKPETTEFFNAIKNRPCGFRSHCKECIKKANAKRYQDNKEVIYKRSRQWKLDHPEHVKEWQRKYYWDNHERVLELKRKYTDKNREVLRKRSLSWRANNLEREKNRKSIYQKNNRDKDLINKQKRLALKKSLYANFSTIDWKNTQNYFEYKCAYCDSNEKLTQDHFVPLTKGGEYTINNIIPACGRCNFSKHNKDFFEWYQKQFYYSKKREQKILKYLNYEGRNQQTALF